MFRQLKEIFRKEEVHPLTLAPGDLPGWLKEEYSIVGKKEKDLIGSSREKILRYIGNLRVLVESLGTAEHEGVVHPKLGNVVEKSLPLYKKTITSALTRDFPEKPDDFYMAATECLKGCLKSSAGPGRYLMGVFPEDMKAIRAAIDQIGREINVMNPVIAEARKKEEVLNKIRQLHDSYGHACEELQKAKNQNLQFADRSMVLKGEIEGIQTQLSRLSHDPRMKELDELHAEEKQLQADHQRATGVFSSYGDMIVHVLKRAEKVAQKDHHMALAKKVHNLAELLVKNEIPEITVLCEELNDVLPEIIVMVSRGDISLRNKDEQHYFSNPAVLPMKMQEIFNRIERTTHQLKETRRKIAGSSFIHEKESNDRHYHMKLGELKEVEQSRVALDVRVGQLKAEIPSFLHQMEEKISVYTGKKAVVIPDTGIQG
ncbi:MAG: hypothetical protein MUF37_02935 [Methanoregulaceae archaeon]|jgi:hypothetical protein|nr:hypothetical protein [Methanoregulaceae archaeon]